MKNIRRLLFLLLMLAVSVSCSADASGSMLPADRDTDPQACFQVCRRTASGEGKGCVNRAEFVEDVTYPDGTVIGPGEPFTKIWRLRNTGSCTWDAAYKVVSSGEFHMGGAQSAYIGKSVKPGETADIQMEMVAPVIYGSFLSRYLLEDEYGNRFGITGSRTGKEMPFWLRLRVEDTSACSLVAASPYGVWRYADFDALFRIRNTSDAEWKAGEVDIRVVSGDEFLKYKDKRLSGLSGNVGPDEAISVIFDMIAPENAGSYRFTIELVRNGDVICSLTNPITVY